MYRMNGLRLRFAKKIKTHAILPVAKHTLETRESDRRFFQRTKCNYHVNSDQDSKETLFHKYFCTFLTYRSEFRVVLLTVIVFLPIYLCYLTVRHFNKPLVNCGVFILFSIKSTCLCGRGKAHFAGKQCGKYPVGV